MQAALLKSPVLRLGESVPSLEYQTRAFEYLESHAHKLVLDADDSLLNYNDKPDRYFYVLQGSICAAAVAAGDGNELLHEYLPGQGFGEQFLLHDGARLTLNLFAGKNGATVQSISREQFQTQFASIFSQLGPFRGRIVRAKTSKTTLALARDVCEFRGIRYASRSSRFALPELLDPVASAVVVVDALEFGPECAQIKEGMTEMMGAVSKPRSRPTLLDFVNNNNARAGDKKLMDEDCLCLNVFAPNPSSKKLPVMVWIHGGAFVTGSGSLPLYNGRELAAKGVVVVTINYRLGALGFLFGVRGLELNLGLHDQITALRWVKRHIAQFGGDADNVTVFGESAGGMSATCLLGMQVRKTESLFHKCIVQSGGGHAVMNEAQGELVGGIFTKALAEILKLEGGSSAVTLDVLNTCDLQAIVDATGQVIKRASLAKEMYGYAIPFQPVILQNGPASQDLLFGSVPPLVSIARGVADDVALLVGVNNSEYTLFMMDGAWKRRLVKLKHSRAAYRQFLLTRLVDFASEEDARHRPVRNVLDRAQAVVDYYLPPRNSSEDDNLSEEEAMSAFERIHSCWLFEIGSDQLLMFKRLDRGRAPVLSYRLCFQSQIQELKCPHAIDLPLVFGTFKTDQLGMLLCGDNPETKACSQEMMEYWTNFASGNIRAGENDGRPKLFADNIAENPTPTIPHSLFRTETEQSLWQGFMEKVELNYAEARRQSKL